MQLRGGGRVTFIQPSQPRALVYGMRTVERKIGLGVPHGRFVRQDSAFRNWGHAPVNDPGAGLCSGEMRSSFPASPTSSTKVPGPGSAWLCLFLIQINLDRQWLLKPWAVRKFLGTQHSGWGVQWFK